jgi:azurin
MKIRNILISTLLVFCGILEAATYTPSFELDYQKCGSNPVIAGSSVTFGSGSTCAAGRVVSTKAYKNITTITATMDLSKMTQNFVNASFYMVSNPTNPSTQPKGSNYCDAGGNNTQWNCREIDMLETNGNKITQTTLHLGDGGINGPQRFEYSFAATANNSCYNYSTMTASPTATNGLHSMVGVIDMTKPFDMVTDFTYGTTPTMTVTYSQDGKSVVVYNSLIGSGAEGSGTVDMTLLTTSMKNGYWLNLAFWQGYSPTGPGSAPWWNNSCSWGALCNSTGAYWSISNIQVTADSVIK